MKLRTGVPSVRRWHWLKPGEIKWLISVKSHKLNHAIKIMHRLVAIWVGVMKTLLERIKILRQRQYFTKGHAKLEVVEAAQILLHTFIGETVLILIGKLRAICTKRAVLSTTALAVCSINFTCEILLQKMGQFLEDCH